MIFRGGWLSVVVALVLLVAGVSPVGAQTQTDSSQEPGGDFDVTEGLGPESLGPEGLLGPELGTRYTADAVVYPNLGSQLSALAVAVEEGDGIDAASPGVAVGPTLSSGSNSTLGGDPLLLTIQLDGNRDGVVEFLASNGVSPSNEVGDYLEVYVPPGLLGPLAGQTGVSRVREMPDPFKDRGQIASPGVALHDALAWHRNGFTGDGVKVGVIDVATTATARDGFSGLRALMGTELPSSVVGRCYTGAGQHTSSLANCDAPNGDGHGTLVAETLMDMAPDAELYVSNPLTWADLHSAVVWMHGQGVKLIVYSVGWSWHGAANGTSPTNPSPLNTAKWAADNGIVWVNSAGNYGRKSWLGAFADTDSDGYHEWAGTGATADEAQEFSLRAGDYMYIALRWDDAWGGSTKDLDLEVRYSATRGGTQRVVGTSADPQSGGATHYPYEGARLTVKQGGNGYYSFYVKKKTSSDAPSWVQVAVITSDVSNLDHYTLSGGIMSPADSSHAGVLAVGAADYQFPDTISSYSSRGPTPDNRTKPDITGVDCAPTTLVQSFCGTSQAAPHVAGLAALVIGRYPSLTPQQVAAYLKTNAEDRGTSGADNTWGHGFALLPSDGLTPVGDGCADALEGSGSVQGNWSSTWCRSQARSRSYARYYTFSLDREARVRIDLESKVDAYLYLRRGLDQRSGNYVVRDDDSGEGRNSRIATTLGAGDYTIEATTYTFFQVGAFTLSVAGVPNQSAEPVVSVAAGAEVTEGGDASFTVSASPAPSQPLSVSVSVAQTGDFGATTGSRAVTVPTSGTATVTVATSDDSADEPDGSVSVTVASGSGYTVSSTAGSATVNVADDDDPVPVVSVAAGVGITEGADASFTVTADPAPSQPLSVSVSVAQTGDFGATTGSRTVTVPTGGTATVTVATSDDSADEPDGSVSVTVSSGSGYTVSGTQGTATVDVADDDDPPVSVDGCAEALAGSGTVQGRWESSCESVARSVRYARFFTFSLASQASVRIDLESSHDTYLYLRRGLDRRSGSVVVRNDDGGVGLNSRISTTLAAGDYTIEATTYSTRRSGPFTLKVAGVPAQSPTRVVPVVSVTAGSGVTEGGDASFTVSASPAPSQELLVDVTVAQSGDFGVSMVSGTVTVPTSGTAAFTVSTTDDDSDEPDGSVSVTVSSGSGYTVSATAGSASVVVSDDDDPPAGCGSADVLAVEARANHDALANTAANRKERNDWWRAWIALSGATGTYNTPLTVAEALVLESGDARWTPFRAALECLEGTPPPATPVVSVTAGSGVTEGADASFTVSASPAPSAPLQVSVSVSQSGDWGVTTGTRSVTVPTGGTAAVTVATADDDADEPDGSVSVAVADGSGYTVSTAQGSATVAVSDDDDPPPATPEISVTAGSGVTEGANASFTVSASPAPSAPLQVSVSVSQSGDWGVTTGTRSVTVPTGGTAAVTVATADDDADEPDGSVSVAVADGSGYTVSTTQSSASVVVADDDDPPPVVPEISVTAGSGVTEGANASFTVTADPAPSQPLTVDVTVSQSGDWGAATGTRSVTVPTSGSVAVTVATADDDADEPDGSVSVTVSSGDGYTVSSTAGSASVAVADDDDPLPADLPVVSVSDASVVEGELGWLSPLEFRLTLSEPSDQNITVRYRVHLGTTSPSDHYGGSSRATIWAGRTHAAIVVLVVDDTRREGEESLEIELTGADGAAIDADNNTATGTITDND
ncbi:MAG: S8 family serine peptidase [bacterium]|nr:S8 family serine peptidase [bacterium]